MSCKFEESIFIGISSLLSTMCFPLTFLNTLQWTGDKNANSDQNLSLKCRGFGTPPLSPSQRVVHAKVLKYLDRKGIFRIPTYTTTVLFFVSFSKFEGLLLCAIFQCCDGVFTPHRRRADMPADVPEIPEARRGTIPAAAAGQALCRCLHATDRAIRLEK